MIDDIQPAVAATPPIKVLLLTGQSNRYHNWALSSVMLQRILEQAGIFVVDRATTPPTGADMSGFRPEFAGHDAIVMDYEGDEWPEATREEFVAFVRGGGGLVVYHGADNAFPHWREFNEMIGIGGWGLQPDGSVGVRDESWGPKVRWRDGRAVLDDSPGRPGHPPKHDFLVEVRAPEHPIMRGMPLRWMHPNDEIYSQLRGPARNLEVLATAYADRSKHPGASGEHEPMLMAIRFGQGRVFHTTLGHVGSGDVEPIAQMDCVGFIATFQRGTEWAATGSVTQGLPENFPTEKSISLRTR